MARLHPPSTHWNDTCRVADNYDGIYDDDDAIAVPHSDRINLNGKHPMINYHVIPISIAD